MTQSEDVSQPRPTGDPVTRHIRQVILVLLVIVLIIVVGFFLDARMNGRGPLAQTLPQTSSPEPSLTASQTDSSGVLSSSITPSLTSTEQPETVTPSATLPETPEPEVQGGTDFDLDKGVIFLSLAEGGHNRLFAYHPQNLPITRLTAGAWDDIDPAASPDGKRLAFASNRDGAWDIYFLELATGKTSRFTDTPEYDGSPSWSPDGLWLVYESYTTTLTVLAPLDSSAPQLTATLPVTITIPNLEILVQPADGSQAALRLTDDPAADMDPAWSPRDGRLRSCPTAAGKTRSGWRT